MVILGGDQSNNAGTPEKPCPLSIVGEKRRIVIAGAERRTTKTPKCGGSHIIAAPKAGGLGRQQSDGGGGLLLCANWRNGEAVALSTKSISSIM